MTASFFFEMGWKSALIAAAALLLAAALRSRAPADRAMVLRIGIAMLLALPVIAVLMPALRVEAWAAPEALPVSSPMPVYQAQALPLPDYGGAEMTDPTIWDDPTPLVILAYLGGLLMAAGRLGAGLWTLRRWTREAIPVADTDWLSAFERAHADVAGGERIRLLLSAGVPSPLSWGWRKPVILIDSDTLLQPDDAEAILAHEVAHIARRDWPALMLSRIASAIFWFNPLVWRLEREVVQQSEEAADLEATAQVEPADYAQALLSWAQAEPYALPANSIAPSESALARRVRAVLEGRGRDCAAGSALTVLAMMLCVGFAAPVAAVELVEAQPPLPPAAPVAPVAPPALAAAAPTAPLAPTAPAPAPVALAAVAALPDQPDQPSAAPAPAPVPAVLAVAAPTPPTPPTPAAAPTPPTPPAPLVDVDKLVEMRIHGITAAVMAQFAAIGPTYSRLTPDQLIAMRIQGVTPGFIRGMAAAGYPALTPEQLVAMRIHGVSPSQARRAIRIEGRRPSAERLVEMAIHGKI